MVLYPYIPYAYFLKSRLVTRFQRVSWFFVYFVPIIIFWLIYDPGVSVIYLIASYVVVNIIYENGYIQNDNFTIKKESNPTIRIPYADIEFIQKNSRGIFVFRLLTIFLFLFLVFCFSDWYVFLLFLALSSALQVLFIFYNNVRSRVNLFLILPLSYLRFYAPVVALCLAEGRSDIVAFLFFLYPLPKFLEFIKNPKYSLPKISSLIGNIDNFRVVYYFSFLVLSALFQDEGLLIFLAAYYFFYRLSSLVVFRVFLKGDAKLLSKSSSDRKYR